MAMTSWDTILNRLPDDSTSLRFRLGLPSRSSGSLTLGSAEATGVEPICPVCMSVSALVPADSPSGDAGAIVLYSPKLTSTQDASQIGVARCSCKLVGPFTVLLQALYMLRICRFSSGKSHGSCVTNNPTTASCCHHAVTFLPYLRMPWLWRCNLRPATGK